VAENALRAESAPIPPTVADDLPKFESQTPMPAAGENATPAPEGSTPIPDYRIVGEVFHSYLIVETGEKMLLIDKHAAHERILFEKLKAGLSEVEVVSQMLMLPVEVMMTSGEVEALKDYNAELEKIGFSMRYARNTVSVDAIPESVDVGDVSDMLQTMAGRVLNATGSVKLTRDIIFEKALYQAACKAAIKAGRVYSDEHIKWIVDQLMTIPNITFCPHGRPVALELSHHTLDKQFDRTGF
jgi:DNA mismatch repair protein MutL